MTEKDQPASSFDLIKLSRLGKELLQFTTRGDRIGHFLSSLEAWFDCNAETFSFQLNNLSAQMNRFKKIELGIPNEFHLFLRERLKNFPAELDLVESTLPEKKSRPRKQIILPILNDGIELIFISLSRHGGAKFNKKELSELQNIITSISYAFFSRNKAEQFATLVDLSNVITSILNLDDLLREAAQFVQNHFNYQDVLIFTVHPGRQKILYQTGQGQNSGRINKEALTYDTNDPIGLVPLVSRTGKSFKCNDVLSEPLYKKFVGVLEDTRSELVIPMVYGGEILGILDIHSSIPDGFSQEDVFLLETIADNIAIAIRNASLYRSEQWRRKVADSVREVAGLLTAETDLEHVLDSILTELEKTLPCDFSSIWLLESNDRKEGDNPLQNLKLSAVHTSYSGIKPNGEIETITPDLVMQVCCGIPLVSPWLLEASNANQPLIRTTQTPYEPIASILDFSEDYSAIAAPLYAGSSRLGVLVLGHHTSGRYGHEAQQIVATFASYAAVAIQNTRLYTAAHDQAWISTVLLQVADATQSITDLDQLLGTMARITPMLIGVKACIIFTWDEDIKAFTPRSTYGLDEESHNEIMGWTIRDGEFAEFEKLKTTKNQVFIYRQENSESINHLYSLFPLDSGILAIFPMLSRGDLIGAFLVDFNENFALDLNGQKDYLLDESTSIIQGIAHQTAIAVENIKLYESQKEEAYVSIALLQVAQAIVSTGSLDEILETIVRITPILVGMKRVAIYLWEEAQEIFNLSHSYGISRQEMTDLKRSLEAEEFPLLKMVKNCQCPAFVVLDQTTDAPLNWYQIDERNISAISPDSVSNPIRLSATKTDPDVPGGFNDNDAILSIQSPLLYAYPLSIKGNLLGVLVAQEVSNTPHIISPRIRFRRQEITTGITQQAALAIQNEKLQQEAVQQERLERELQLAREIQQNFLPNSLPAIPGWDLDVLWRPAREVGGDFYDVFPLPGNRIGVVIADVADKGMPAALFMTLVRTLIRATARDELSPSIVLENVNDLLVAETERGLFITTFYLVITPLTGQFIYANAGHNPPLLLRPGSRTIESLAPTGMALGVLENIHIKESVVTLDPGDGVVLYTDGVTESFSIDGEMYGENRLRTSLLGYIQDNPSHSAAELKELIDKSVQTFSEGCAIADDLTLVTIKRNI